MSEKWRVGSKVPQNVYDGDRPVCQCHNAEDAARIVAAVNAAYATAMDHDWECFAPTGYYFWRCRKCNMTHPYPLDLCADFPCAGKDQA